MLTLLVFDLQILMNVQPIPVGVVKPVVTLMDPLAVTVMKDMNCPMIKEHVGTLMSVWWMNMTASSYV